MKTLSLIILFTFFSLFSNAQDVDNCTRELSGKITNYVTSETITEVAVKLFIQGETEPVNSIVVGEDANYSFVLDCSKRYVLEAGKENFTISRKIIYPSSKKKENILDLSLFPISEFLIRDTNKLIDVGHIGFESDGDKITPLMEEKLKKVAIVMNKYPNIRVSVDVHTDSKGEPAYSLSISKERADTVVSYLAGEGIDPERLESYGYGDTQLVNHCAKDVNCSELEHKENRRVDFVVLE